MHVVAKQFQSSQQGIMIPTHCAVLERCNRKGALLLVIYAIKTVRSRTD
jgi:hypothetical protein